MAPRYFFLSQITRQKLPLVNFKNRRYLDRSVLFERDSEHFVIVLCLRDYVSRLYRWQNLKQVSESVSVTQKFYIIRIAKVFQQLFIVSDCKIRQTISRRFFDSVCGTPRRWRIKIGKNIQLILAKVDFLIDLKISRRGEERYQSLFLFLFFFFVSTSSTNIEEKVGKEKEKYILDRYDRVSAGPVNYANCESFLWRGWIFMGVAIRRLSRNGTRVQKTDRKQEERWSAKIIILFIK